MKNITTMERIEVACEKYESNCLFDIQKEDVIKEVMEKKDEDKEKKKKMEDTLIGYQFCFSSLNFISMSNHENFIKLFVVIVMV